MAKKTANTNNSSMETPGGAAPKRASVSKAKKHIRAQAAGVAAAVEGFVHAIATPSEEETPKPAATDILEAPVVEAPVAREAAPVTHEAIAQLAYQFYLDREGRGGSQADDWFRAEETLKAKSASV